MVGLIQTIARPLFILISIIILFALTVSWIATVVGAITAYPFLQFIHPSEPFLTALGLTNVVIIIGLPLALIGIRLTRLWFDTTKLSVPILIALWSFWSANLASLGSIGGFTAKSFNSSETFEKESLSSTSTDNTIHIRMNDGSRSNSILQLGRLTLDDRQLISDHIQVRITKSKDDKIHITQQNYARGNSSNEANSLAQSVPILFTQTSDNEIEIQPDFILSAGEKWRNQHANIQIAIPEGKFVQYDKNVERKLNMSRQYRSKGASKQWQMTGEGLSCLDCVDETEDSFPKLQYSDFDQLRISGKIKVQINKTNDDYRISLEGRDIYKEQVELTQIDNTLVIHTDLTRTSSPLRLTIDMPHLVGLDLENTDDIKIQGFKESQFHLHSEGHHEIKAYMDVDSLEAHLIGGNELDLRGNGKYMKVNLSDRAKLDGERFSTKAVYLNATDHSKAKLAVSDTLFQRTDPSCDVELTEGATVVASNY